MRYKLAPYMHLGYDGQYLKVGYGSIQEKIDQDVCSIFIKFMGFVKDYKTIHEMKTYLIEQEAISDIDAQNMINLFLNNKYLTQEGELADHQQYFARDLLFYGLYTFSPSCVIKKLSSKNIAIIGCGGIGSHIAVTLANKGIGKLILVDHDTVEKSNLNRNFIFKRDDIGKSKVSVLTSHITTFSICKPQLIPIEEKLDSYSKLDILVNTDFVVLSCDDYRFIRFVTPFLYKNRIPHIIAGYLEDIIIWGPLFVPGVTPCYHCFAKNHIDTMGDFEQNLNNIMMDINSSYIAPAVAELTLISSAFASLDIVRFLGEFGQTFSLGKRVGLWSHDMHIQTQECMRQENCDICGLV